MHLANEPIQDLVYPALPRRLVLPWECAQIPTYQSTQRHQRNGRILGTRKGTSHGKAGSSRSRAEWCRVLVCKMEFELDELRLSRDDINLARRTLGAKVIIWPHEGHPPFHDDAEMAKIFEDSLEWEKSCGLDFTNLNNYPDYITFWIWVDST